ncbi:hypothetical protein FQR65_LT16032 [Abscondita terminalis]|nr:hypothetical protein FQR65_LT16032 [Abscondita terminalis]
MYSIVNSTAPSPLRKGEIIISNYRNRISLPPGPLRKRCGTPKGHYYSQKHAELPQHRIREAYNKLDIAGMLADLDDEIRFVNITDGEINLSLLGRRAFWDQAVQAAELFSERKQEILAVQHFPEETEIEIDYSAKLAVDLPNGYERGQVISMKGRSIFRFWGTDKIISLTDIS